MKRFFISYVAQFEGCNYNYSGDCVRMITSIPNLIKEFGTMAETCRQTGINEMTIAKYSKDVDCERHVIYNNRLMTHVKTSPVLFTRRGITKTEQRIARGESGE